MNIVFISSLMTPRFIGGAEILTLLIAEGLAKRGHKVTIFTGGKETKKTIKGVIIKEISELNWSLRFRSLLIPLYTYCLRKRLLKEKEFLSADIIHTTDFDSITALADWSFIRDKLVVTIQDYGLVCPTGNLLINKKICPNYCHLNKGFLCLKKKESNWLEKIYLKTAFSIRKQWRDRKLSHVTNAVGVSKFVTKEILKINPKIKITLIGNCLPKGWRKISLLVKRDIDILYAGSFKIHKGLELLIRALKIIQQKTRLKKIKIFFVGNSNKKNICLRLIKKFNLKSKIEFAGEIDFDKMPEYYRRAKIVLVPSLWPEPCGRVIIEAMSFKCLVLAADSGGTPELVSNGENGFLFKRGNAKDLASKISYLIVNYKKFSKIGLKAKNYVWRKFSQLEVAKKYEITYSKLLKQKREE